MNKAEIKAFWDTHPSGSQVAHHPPGTKEYFEEIETYRYSVEPFIHDIVRFPQWKGKKVLEVGCGMGMDLLHFARAGADVTGIDRSTTSIQLSQKRFVLYGARGEIREADAESLPFPDSTFDLVYSWGVIHHTPQTEKTIEEIYRVTKPGGRIIIMIYHRYSWAVLRILLKYGILRGEILRSTVQDIISRHSETTDGKNPLTKVYSQREARRMFSRFVNLTTTVYATASDGTRVPRIIKNLLSSWIGWYLVITGEKPPKDV